MKTLELNQMEEINGMSACSWGLFAVATFWTVAIGVATAGSGAGIVASVLVGGGYQALSEAICD